MAGTSDDWLGDLDLGAIRAAVALAPDAYEQEAARDGPVGACVRTTGTRYREVSGTVWSPSCGSSPR